jgi:hypothetical protein
MLLISPQIVEKVENGNREKFPIFSLAAVAALAVAEKGCAAAIVAINKF